MEITLTKKIRKRILNKSSQLCLVMALRYNFVRMEEINSSTKTISRSIFHWLLMLVPMRLLSRSKLFGLVLIPYLWVKSIWFPIYLLQRLRIEFVEKRLLTQSVFVSTHLTKVARLKAKQSRCSGECLKDSLKSKEVST